MRLLVPLSVLSTVPITPTNAAPAPIPVPVAEPEPELLNDVLQLTKNLLNILNNTLDRLLNPTPTKAPKSVSDIEPYLKARYASRPTNLRYTSNGLSYSANGLVVKNLGVEGAAGATINDSPQGINSFVKTNPPPPAPIYPRLSPSDAPYSLTETQLRAAIYIPSTFDPKNALKPVLLDPGTGDFGGINFEGNFAKLFERDPSLGQAV